MSFSLTVFQSRAGDRNNLAIPGARSLATELSRRLGAEAVVLGHAQPALNARWDAELLASMPALRALGERFDQLYSLGHKSVAATAGARSRLQRCLSSQSTAGTLASCGSMRMAI